MLSNTELPLSVRVRLTSATPRQSRDRQSSVVIGVSGSRRAARKLRVEPLRQRAGTSASDDIHSSSVVREEEEDENFIFSRAWYLN